MSPLVLGLVLLLLGLAAGSVIVFLAKPIPPLPHVGQDRDELAGLDADLHAH